LSTDARLKIRNKSLLFFQKVSMRLVYNDERGAWEREPPFLVPTLRVGMHAWTLRVLQTRT
jgi:hypothetical protein